MGIEFTPKIELGRYYYRYRAERAVAGLVSRIPGFNGMISRLQQWFRRAESILYVLNRRAHSEKAFREYLASRAKAEGHGAAASEFASGYGYADPAEERRVAQMYRDEVLSGHYSNRETPVLNEHAISTIADLLRANRSLKRIVNFGVSYAHVDSELAKLFSDVQFVGIDRSQAVCELNRETFAPLNNIQFEAGDILAWVGRHGDLGDTLFFHMRTTALLPASFVESLYSSLAARRCGMICGFEPMGLSRETNRFYAQSLECKPSALYRDTMYLHNYAGVLHALGYATERMEYVKTAHVDPDYHIQSFTARRREQE